MKSKTNTYAKAIGLIKKHRTEIVWQKADGEEIVLHELSDMHLKNIIVFINKKQEEYEKYKLGDYVINSMIAKQWLTILRDELDYRIKNKITVDEEGNNYH